MLNEQDLIQRDMERTRGSLTEKLEALEGQVAETVSSTAGAVQDTTQAVQETVAAVKETVQETMSAVTDKVQETVQSVGEAFNLRRQMERHPWLVLGGAVAVGCMVGASFGSDETATDKTPAAATPPSPPPPWSGRANARESAVSDSDRHGLWGDALSQLKNLGVSYVMGIVRDLARNELPEAVASRVADEVDALTSKLGTSPLPGPVLPAKTATGRGNCLPFALANQSRRRSFDRLRLRAPSWQEEPVREADSSQACW